MEAHDCLKACCLMHIMTAHNRTIFQTRFLDTIILGILFVFSISQVNSLLQFTGPNFNSVILTTESQFFVVANFTVTFPIPAYILAGIPKNQQILHPTEKQYLETQGLFLIPSFSQLNHNYFYFSGNFTFTIPDSRLYSGLHPASRLKKTANPASRRSYCGPLIIN